MKRDDTKKKFTALSGNDLKTVHPHYLSFPCFIAFVTISEVFCLMRYGSVQNAEIHLFCSESRNFIVKKPKHALSETTLSPSGHRAVSHLLSMKTH